MTPDYQTYVPDLAESWKISDDATTFTFHLVEDATWHDGEPFDADDVIFTITRAVQEADAYTAYPITSWLAIKGADAIKGTTESARGPREGRSPHRPRDPGRTEHAVLPQPDGPCVLDHARASAGRCDGGPAQGEPPVLDPDAGRHRSVHLRPVRAGSVRGVRRESHPTSRVLPKRQRGSSIGCWIPRRRRRRSRPASWTCCWRPTSRTGSASAASRQRTCWRSSPSLPSTSSSGTTTRSSQTSASDRRSSMRMIGARSLRTCSVAWAGSSGSRRRSTPPSRGWTSIRTTLRRRRHCSRKRLRFRRTVHLHLRER